MQNNAVASMPFSMKVRSFIRQSPARMAVIIAVLLYGATVLMVPTALNMGAISSIVMLTLLLSFASAGQTIVLIGGGLDFTVGAVMSTSAILTVNIMNNQDGMFIPAFAAVMLMAVTVGLINGFCTVKIGLPALIVTLAISNVISRLQYVFTQGSPTGYAGPAFVNTVISRIFGHIPSLALYALIVFPLVFYILNRSRYGRQLYLVGNNATAAGLTGINVNRVKIMSYVISAMFAGFTGMLAAGYMQRAQCQMFDDYAYNSLIAVIVGGTAFSGGIGTYTGTIAGSLLMVVLTNMLTALFLPQPVRNIIMGVIMVLLLLFYNRKKAVRQ